ncbi:MAG: aminoglycoside phosphotransferase family protein, partial [Candidatus Bipolaricaulota bacterium]|nr:aminoglycoside phosphotransferase family protein [Candidatus Bipolaricaulota bacterium]
MTDRELIGVGRTAEVFSWDEDHVIKLFRAGFRREDAAFEAQATARIYQAGIAAPAVLLADTPDGLFEEEGRFGVVFERVRGPSMLRELVAHPLRLRTYSREFARLHAEMHATRIPDLPSQRDGILWAVNQGAAAAGRSELAEQARERVSKLLDGDAVCHGDFHPDNVLLSERGPILIDWGPACCGSAAADVARTVLLVKYGGYPIGSPLRARVVIGLLRRLFLRV